MARNLDDSWGRYLFAERFEATDESEERLKCDYRCMFFGVGRRGLLF